ncbi:MAG: hypothetical protein J1D86_03580 [Alistipes sp.]|nr:hypothetical protein [Alistipes sp.]
MKISRKHIDPADTAAVDAAFAAVEQQPVACCNWADYPYSPQVSFRAFHTGQTLMLRFDVQERHTAALVTDDNGGVWNDSCVEFFLSVDGQGYYNFEFNCIGTMLLGFRRSRNEGVVHAAADTLASIERRTTLPHAAFAERTGDNSWSLTAAIPVQALFRHRIKSFSGLAARANLYKCGDQLSKPHFLSWQPIQTPSPDFHRPEFFAPIEFE